MNAKELRIGNYVNVINPGWSQYHGKPLEVTGIEKRSDKHFPKSEHIISMETGDFQGNICQFEEFVTHIPLTEQWLLDFGFEKKKGEIPENIDFNIGYFKVQQHLEVQDFICLNTDPHVSIKNIHQLQNLYYALTGHDLIYTPSK